MEFHLKVASTLAKLLENQFKIFGFRFGLDPLIGLVPWIGDATALFLSIYIIWIAKKLDVPDEKIALMVQNTIVDFLLGLIPVIGDIGDFLFKSNSKNLKILIDHVKVVDGQVIQERNPRLLAFFK